MNNLFGKVSDALIASFLFIIRCIILFLSWIGLYIVTGYAIQSLFVLMFTFTPFGLAWCVAILMIIACVFAATYPKLDAVDRGLPLAGVYIFLLIRYLL